MAARCVGVMSKIATMETMNIFLEKVLPWLGAIDDNIKQEGAIEALACILLFWQTIQKFILFKDNQSKIYSHLHINNLPCFQKKTIFYFEVH